VEGSSKPSIHLPCVRRLGVCGHVHVVERCSFHVQRYPHHGRARSCGHHVVLALGRLERLGSILEEIRHPHAGRPHFRRPQSGVAHPAVFRCLPRDDHAVRAASHLRVGLGHSWYLQPRGRNRRANLQHRSRHPPLQRLGLLCLGQQHLRRSLVPGQFRFLVQRQRLEHSVRVVGRTRR